MFEARRLADIRRAWSNSGASCSFPANACGRSRFSIDGATRDTLQITKVGFPVFASHVSVSFPGKRDPGAVNVPVVVAGATVNPSDLIVGDADGVIAIPPAQVETSVRNAEARMAKEAEQKRWLDEGQTLYDVAGMKAVFEAADIVEIDTVWSDA